MARKKEKTRAEKLYEAWIVTHMKTDYRNAPGCKKLGITNAKPIADAKKKELLVVGWDDQGPVTISREEALGTVWVPSPAEIEQRKQECKFLFPDTNRERERRHKIANEYRLPISSLSLTHQPIRSEMD
jgi:hypothetical protein